MPGESLIDHMPFSRRLRIELVSASPEEVVGRMPWDPEHCTTGGALHGGAIMALADSLGGICAYLNLPEGASTSTVESKTNFFRALTEGHLEGRARRLHVGRRHIVVQTDLLDGEGRLVGQTTQTQAVVS
jgi:1,4-dihydroxy-2-naphthoyl-CoA hydrolase